MNIEQFLNEKNDFLDAFLSRERKVAKEIADKIIKFSHVYLEKMSKNYLVIKQEKSHYIEAKGITKYNIFQFFKRVWLEYVLNKKRDDFFKIWQSLTFE